MNITNLIKKLRIAGLTVASIFRDERITTQRSLEKVWRSAVLSDMDKSEFSTLLSGTIKSRNRAFLRALKNVNTAARGQIRAIIHGGINGYWENVGVFDSGQTVECSSYMGKIWELPYSQIPNKPPRIRSIPHDCRSWLNFVAEGEEPIDQSKFMTQWKNSSLSVKRELLGKTRFELWQAGKIEIESISQYERTQLFTLKELGLE